MTANFSTYPWRGSVLNALPKSRNTALTILHPLSKRVFIACVRHETTSRVLHLLYTQIGMDHLVVS